MIPKKTVLLRNIPTDVDRLIDKEQLRLSLHEDLKLKKPEVVYRMLKEWYKSKNEPIINEI